MSCFEIKNIVKRVGHREILNIESLCLPRNKITTILGPNGAGKTSLLKILIGIDEEYQGQLNYDGKPIRSYSKKALSQSLAWVPSQSSLSFDTSVWELVLLGRYPWNRASLSLADKEIAERALQSMNISGLKHRMYSTLSSGERQKVQIARALTTDVQCLVLDEPCSHLDVKARYDLYLILKNVAATGRTIILTSHDIFMSRKFAQNTVALKGGRVFLDQRQPLSQHEISMLFDVQLDI